ncbi:MULTISPECIES: multiheme c-type cytochrome [Rhodomicrobium]|uniref:multiheme c-type cytochrome n=1 Tax=Rhodomicrobium TaxID=1068 RepID=UPI000B4A8D13|nr:MULTISPECIES: multiheme c-type cytochrome [Rhodomicrobium]
MKRRTALSMGAFASAVLLQAAFLSHTAVAGSTETLAAPTVQAQPGLRFAQNVGTHGAIDAHSALEALIKEDEAKRASGEGAKSQVVGGEQKLSADADADGYGQTSLLAAAARESKGKESPIPAVDEETLSLYPTAAQCGECHKQIYEEWSSSQHAYASISPMFHAFEQKFQELTRGTVGTFCVRCHQQVGTQLGEARDTPLWARSQISREGISCITCHRVKENYGKVNGERRVEPGKIYEPVYGSGEKSVIKDVLANKDSYSVKTSPEGRGNDIHDGMILNSQMKTSEFCVSCHQVAVNLGIKLEIVWDQYRDSPAKKAGVTCQDCHMGQVPGKAEGYATAPSAIVGGKEINPGRKHANHSFVGPGYSIAHPGIFPQNKKAQAFSIKDWLQFDWRAGWGTKDFEDKVADGKIKVNFPQRWADALDREDGRVIIEENLKKLDARDALRHEVMENSSKVDGPYIESKPRVGGDLAFSYKIKNMNTGHNLPSGSLGAQPQLWVNVALVDPDGQNVWESGYIDSNGDMADLHSLDVAAGSIKTDQQLVHFQTKFLTTNIKGTDREMYLPVNFDIDQLPQLRAPQVPTTVLNHPPLVRMENHSLTPLGEKVASYNVPGRLITKPGKYRLAFRMRSRAEPIYFMRFVGATKEMEQRMNERMASFHAFAVDVEVK